MSEQDDGSAFQRPDDAHGSFAARPVTEQLGSAPPRPPASPDEQQVFGRPRNGADPAAEPPSFAPSVGDRLPPTHPSPPPAVPVEYAETFGGSGNQPFDPAPGTRLPAAGPATASPWWKEGAGADPWRDALSPYWIAGPPIIVDDEVVGMADAVEEDPDDGGADDGKKGGRGRGRG
ncbi:MAG: peptidase and chymotrypsin/Hap, partial [Frankiales bacterium]|nr:peptidase and chymotrypsin/Hap [Frankiales bacterium]